MKVFLLDVSGELLPAQHLISPYLEAVNDQELNLQPGASCTIHERWTTRSGMLSIHATIGTCMTCMCITPSRHYQQSSLHHRSTPAHHPAATHASAWVGVQGEEWGTPSRTWRAR